jgi:spermidine synthase
MKPTETLARDTTPEGEELVLLRRDTVYTLRVNGMELMTSRVHGSEEALAHLACNAIANRSQPRILIGGLGFGYTLRAALDHLPSNAEIILCELFAILLEWNRGPLGNLSGHPLDDSRVTTRNVDVKDELSTSKRYDAIILDVDNGPWGFTLRSNDDLYSQAGIDKLSDALAAKGVLAVWSSEPSPAFENRLSRGGFRVATETVGARGGHKGPRHTIFIATKR